MVLRWLFGSSEAEEPMVMEDRDESSADQSAGQRAEVVCAWCLAKAGMTAQEGSHGICANCAAEVWQHYQQRRRR